MPRRPKPDDEKRKKIGLTLAPDTFDVLEWVGEKLGIDTTSRLVEHLVIEEARRLYHQALPSDAELGIVAIKIAQAINRASPKPSKRVVI